MQPLQRVEAVPACPTSRLHRETSEPQLRRLRERVLLGVHTEWCVDCHRMQQLRAARERCEAVRPSRLRTTSIASAAMLLCTPCSTMGAHGGGARTAAAPPAPPPLRPLRSPPPPRPVPLVPTVAAVHTLPPPRSRPPAWRPSPPPPRPPPRHCCAMRRAPPPRVRQPALVCAPPAPRLRVRVAASRALLLPCSPSRSHRSSEAAPLLAAECSAAVRRCASS
jgi:hypothetical protein